jgi:solute:Na+ symporter, SSS family
MTAGTLALLIIVGIVGIGSAVGFVAGARWKMDLEQWTVAGRGFGVVLVWLLMAGEIYTTFSFLGASGWAYSRGAPTLYILSYQALAYVASFFILPGIWEMGRRHGLQTQPDFFLQRYGSRWLAAFIALVGVLCIIPYLQLQLTGLGIIVEVASYERVHSASAMLISGGLVAAFVFTSGVRAVAWVSVLKDFLLLAAALTIGIGVPYAYFGGIGPMFAELIRTHPSHLTMPGATTNMGHAWYMSTVLLTAFGFYMWPTTFASSYTAKSADTLRRNAVAMPLYSLTLPFIFFTGFAALLVIPGLAQGDLSLLTIVRKTFPTWFLGLVGGAGALTAMVPAAILTLTGATLFAKNVCRVAMPSLTDDQVARLAKRAVLAMMAIALYFAIFSSTTLVSLLLLGYAGVSQFFPGVVLGLYWPRANRYGIFAGTATGVAAAAALMLTGHDPVFGMNAGFVALCANFAVAVVVSLLLPNRPVPLPEAHPTVR